MAHVVARCLDGKEKQRKNTMFENERERGRHGEPRRHGPEEFGHARGRGRARGSRLMHEMLVNRFGPRGPMARRGDVRSAVLTLLAEQPMHGYQIMGELGNRSNGRWRPSAGSIYPTLQQLEDEGLVRGEERDGRRVFSLTDAGKSAVAERRERTPAPWEEMSAATDDALDIRDLTMQVGSAAMQVVLVGPADGTAQARAILIDARRQLYRLLAEEPLDRSADAGPSATD